MALLKFEASWCQPCKKLTQVLDAAGIQYQTIDIDASENEVLCIRHGIRSIPTLLHVESKKYLVGLKSREEVLDWLISCEE